MSKPSRSFARWIAVILALTFICGPVAGQPSDLEALWKRSERAFDAGDYKAAEAAARQSIEFATSRFGADHRSVSRGMVELAKVYIRTDRVQEGERLARRALAIRERAMGPRSAPAAAARGFLGFALSLQARYDEAEANLKQALEILQRVLPVAPWHKGNTLRVLAFTYGQQGRYQEAEATFRVAIAELEKSTGRDGIWTLRTLRQFAALLARMGRYAESEAAFKRAIAGHEARTGKEHSELIQALTSFAHFLTEAGRPGDAKAIFERALAAYESSPFVGELLKAPILHGMGLVHADRSQYAEAESNLRSAIDISERRANADHPAVASIYHSLAQVLGRAGRYDEAEAACRKALAIFETKFGPDSGPVSRSMMLLSWIVAKAGRLEEAKATFERGVARGEELFGADHPRIAIARSTRAEALMSAGRDGEAFEELRLASRTLARINERDEVAGLSAATTEYQPRIRRGVHERLIAISWRNPDVATASGGSSTPAIDHAFMAAQHAAETSTSVAIAQMAARFAAGDTPLAALLRQAQDLALKARGLDDDLVQQYGRRLDADGPSTVRDRGILQKELAAAREELARIDARIRSEYPTYDSLTRTRAFSIADVQELLAEDEALVTTFVGGNATYVWAVSRFASSWTRVDKPDLAQRVEMLRCGLEVAAWTDPKRRERCKSLGLDLQYQDVLPFDLGVAHSLYADLLAPLASVISGKRLIVVPSGPLTSLPFHVLVATPPAAARPSSEEYARADWLIRRHAISTIPTVSSLRALRTAARVPSATRPLIGYGAPLFTGGAPDVPPVGGGARGAQTAAVKGGKQLAAGGKGAARAAKTNAAVAGRPPDFSSLLQPLPDTAIELERIADLLGSMDSTLMLGAAANEANVKRTPLHEYRVVYFATHGLVADEIAGLTEPALVLTPPTALTPADDGLLTASEVAQLRLNADWVVLSACNTAAGSKPGAEALSGLARAFFHAGARAMLVSHWHVYSDAALALTTGTFEELASDQSIGRDEALRRSMLKLINSPSIQNTQPASWAPFVVVGDGQGR
jgi:CHAT domain-containing protein/tetratricopeptide (TPR) repeat protein